MVKCPTCGKELAKPEKTWKYQVYVVEKYKCDNCETNFREYIRDGKFVFSLKQVKGVKWKKVKST